MPKIHRGRGSLYRGRPLQHTCVQKDRKYRRRRHQEYIAIKVQVCNIYREISV
jgi:hypothetical protein